MTQRNYLRRLNGDQHHRGGHVRICFDDLQILHVKLYQYRYVQAS